MAEYNSVNLGRIMPKYTGDYSTNVNYNTLDIVFYEGSSYIATQPSLRQTPAIDSEYWGLISGKGDKGDKGDTGDIGPKGDKGDTGPAGKDAEIPIIGGRNLYLNSRILSDGYGTNGNVMVTVEPFDSTTNMWHLVASQGVGDAIGIYIFNYGEGKIPNNSDWSYSADIKGTGKIIKFGIESDSISTTKGVIGNNWSRVSQTGHVNEPQYKSIVMYFDTTNSPLDVYIKLPKLEIGNIPTDWTPAPEDVDSATAKAQSTADDATVAIKNLSVGGRNYLFNSSGYNLNGWNNNASSWSVTSDDTRGNVFSITPSVTWVGGVTNSLSQKTSSELYRQQVTVSFWAKASVDGANFHSEPSGGANSFNNKLTTSWARYSYTISIFSGTIYLMAVDAGTTYYLDDIKLEVGNVATDWTPAPEDVPSNDAQLVHKTGNETVAGAKTFTDSMVVNNTLEANTLYKHVPSAGGTPFLEMDDTNLGIKQALGHYYSSNSGGNGVTLGAGGLTIVGGGESAKGLGDVINNGLSDTSSSGLPIADHSNEATIIASDSHIYLMPGQQAGYPTLGPSLRFSAQGYLDKYTGSGWTPLITPNSTLLSQDSQVVHKSSDESIAGDKKFSGKVTVDNASKYPLNASVPLASMTILYGTISAIRVGNIVQATYNKPNSTDKVGVNTTSTESIPADFRPIVGVKGAGTDSSGGTVDITLNPNGTLTTGNTYIDSGKSATITFTYPVL